MDNRIRIQTITLSDGTKYTPEKGNEPVSPCWNCPREKRIKCVYNIDCCDKYMDYEHSLAIYRITVFD